MGLTKLMIMSIVVGVICGFIAKRVAQEAEYDPYTWMLVGFFFGLLGIILLYIVIAVSKQENKNVKSIGEVKSLLYYNLSCPVILLDFGLIKNVNDDVFIECSLKNISGRIFKAVIMDIRCYGVDGERFTDIKGYSFLDNTIHHLQKFGQNKKISIPDMRSRKFEFVVRKVLFDDGTWWTNDEEKELSEYNLNIRPIASLGNLSEQYLREIKEIVPDRNSNKHNQRTQEILDIQVCGCGEILSKLDKFCSNCHVNMKELASVDNEDYLKYKLDVFNKEMARKKKEQEEKKTKKKRKAKKVGILASVLLGILGCVLIAVWLHIEPKLKYEEALASMKAHDYASAEKIFYKIRNYEDSEKYMVYCQGFKLLELEEYERASEKFEECGDFKKSVKYVKECKYKRAYALVRKKKFGEAAQIYMELGDYRNSENKLVDIFKENPEIANSLNWLR